MAKGLRDQLREQFQDKECRDIYASDLLDAFIATQIKTLREQRGFTQARLAELTGMKQSRISALEDVNYSSWSMATLKRIAIALDVAPFFSFETFGSLINRAVAFNRPTLERHEPKDDPELKELPAANRTAESTDPIAEGVFIEFSEWLRDTQIKTAYANASWEILVATGAQHGIMTGIGTASPASYYEGTPKIEDHANARN